jgi:hypothetical protein
MKFDVGSAWTRYNHRHINIDDLFDRENCEWIKLVKWLDENVGWLISEHFATLPIMGRGWRIEPAITQRKDSDFKSWGVWLEIDDDTSALQYKLTFE